MLYWIFVKQIQFSTFRYCGQNINIYVYASLEFPIDSISLYMFYFKKRNSNYTRDDQCNHTNDAILTNEKTNHSIWAHYNTKIEEFSTIFFLLKEQIYSIIAPQLTFVPYSNENNITYDHVN